MKKHIRNIATISAIALAGMGLAGCSGEAGATSAKATPDEIAKQYVTHLNAGEITEAFALVEDTENIDPTKVIVLEELKIPEPKLAQGLPEDLKEIEKTSLSFGIGETDHTFYFTKGENGWKIDTADFITTETEDIDHVAAQKIPAFKISKDGNNIASGSRFVAWTENEVTVNGDYSGNSIVEPLTADLSLEIDDSLNHTVRADIASDLIVKKEFTDLLEAKAATYKETSEHDDGTFTSKFVSLESGSCGIGPDHLTAMLQGEEFQATCDGMVSNSATYQLADTSDKPKLFTFDVTPDGGVSFDE